MKTVVLFRARSEHSGAAESFIQDYERQTGLTVEKRELDSVEGAEMAKLYDVMDYPAILVMRDDGSPIGSWTGTNLPSVAEVAHAART